MPFQAKETIVDISIDFSDTDVKIPGQEDQLLKPTKSPNGTNMMIWAKMLTGGLEPKEIEGKTKEEVAILISARHNNDALEAAMTMAKNINFWYDQEITFWMDQVPFALLKEIHGFLNEELFQLKKKFPDTKPLPTLKDTDSA